MLTGTSENSPLLDVDARSALLSRRYTLFALAASCFPISSTAKTIRSWQSLRDDRVVKQQLDYSCGAASLATILREFYSLDLTEADILARLAEDGRYSFADLAAVVKTWGLVGGGIALSFEKLTELKVPAIAYVLYRGQDHFTVIRGINPSTGVVSVADPSWGNRRFKEYQFRRIWEVRDEVGAEGRLLLIVPRSQATVTGIDETFFQTPGGWRTAIRTVGLMSF